MPGSSQNDDNFAAKIIRHHKHIPNIVLIKATTFRSVTLSKRKTTAAKIKVI